MVTRTFSDFVFTEPGMEMEASMKSQIFHLFVFIFLMTVFAGCKADRMEIELYTSDIKKALSQEVLEVPLSATFSVLGEDDEGNFPKVAKTARQYLGKSAEFKTSKGDFGDQMVVKCSVPMGTAEALEEFLEESPRPLALVIDGSTVKLNSTPHLATLNQELSGINLMLDLDFPAKSTVMRFVGDMEKSAEISAIAVFVDEKPELIFEDTIERRKSVEVNFSGGDGSVYSAIMPQFEINFE